MRTRTRAALAALPVAFTLALTGCGSDDGGGDVASAGDAEQDGSPSASPKLSRHEQNLRYARCLRRHGLEIADPEPGKGLALSIDGRTKAKADKAMAACREYAPPAPSDEHKAKEREEMLEFARCMRRNGVKSFRDPKPGGGVNIGPEQAEDPDFAKAEKKCGGGGDTNSRQDRP